MKNQLMKTKPVQKMKLNSSEKMKQKSFNIRNITGKGDKAQTLILEGDLGIKNAAAMTKTLLSLKFNGEKLIFNLRKVEKLDITTIQVVRSFEKYLTDMGIKIEITSEFSDDIKKLLANTGFTSSLSNS